LADTFALHRAEPIISGNRLVCWWRYGLYLNDMYYHHAENCPTNLYKIKEDSLFSNIEKNEHNLYLFRGFIE
jgi:hypothetical protein